jgi:hypothetical protein
MSLTHIFQLIFALGLLLLGRKLYWAFVGAVGFIAVTELVMANFSAQPDWLVLVIGLAAGILGAILAIFVRMAGISLAGLLGGAYVFLMISRLGSITNPALKWILIGIGAIAGLLLVLMLFDWALILISSLTGAFMLARFVPIPTPLNWLLIGVLLAVGILVQTKILSKVDS